MNNCPVLEVKFGDVVISSLLDTGSMVTTITESCYNKHFAHLENVPLHDCSWLDLRAGNGLKLPYLGYLELDITVLGNCMPSMGIFVVKDHQMQYKKFKTPAVLGMNIIKGFYQELFQQHGASLFDIPSVQDSAPGWRQALRHCQV